MKPLPSWLAQVGLAGTCAVWAGCGGSDVPDPDSDSRASASPAPSGAPSVAAVPPGAAAPSAAPAMMPPPMMPGSPAAPGGSTSPNPVGSASATSPAPGASATPAADQAASAETSAEKGEGSSATSEMLALASAPAAGEKTEGDDKAGGSSSGGSMPGMPGGGGSRPPGMPANMPIPGASSGSSMTSDAIAKMPGYAQNAAAPVGGSMPAMPGMPGMAGMPGTGGGNAGGGEGGRADYTSPGSAVASFLNALRVKDPERLAEATALRAPTEASPAYRKVFTSILEQSLAPEELEELSKKFDGMQPVGQNDPKTTGRLGIIYGKMEKNGSQLTRTFTARHEKNGWKVVDISGQRVFEKPIAMPRMGGTGRTGGFR